MSKPVKARVKEYLKENLGAPFVIAFMSSLMVNAVFLIMGKKDYANVTAVFGYFLLLVGIILQLISFIRTKPSRASNDDVETNKI